MKALKLSSNPDERRELKAQCGEIMTVADHIKKSPNWTPSAQQQPKSVKNTRIDQWAKDVAGTGGSATTFEDDISQSSSSRHGLSSATAPVGNVGASTGSSMIATAETTEPDLPSNFGLKSNMASQSPVLQVQPTPVKANAAPTSPSVAPYSQIRRLVEPVSSRKRSKREDIILLKASMVNGFKCPPWDKTPGSDEFLATQGAEPFS